jgi:hypothetical protein
MEHLEKIELREPDRSDVESIPHFKKACEMYEKLGGAYTLLSEDGVVCIAGVTPIWPGVGSAWSITSDLVKKYPKSYYKATLQFLGAISGDWKLHRIQTTTHCDNEIAANWLEHLGFVCEGVMKAYGVDKKDHYLYARVN